MPSREKTCGWCGRELSNYYFRDMKRVRGYFCSEEHCIAFIENGNKSNIPDWTEDKETPHKTT